MNKLIEADYLYKFDPATDYVVVMLTGINRFSFYHGNEWRTFGEMSDFSKNSDREWRRHWSSTKKPTHPYTSKMEMFVEDLWNLDWAIYNTWISVIAIKNLLVAKNIKHKIEMAFGVGYDWHQNLQTISPDSVKKIAEIQEIIGSRRVNTPALHVTSKKQVTVYDDGAIDGHPNMSMHYQYAKQNYPEFITETSDNFYQAMAPKLDLSSPSAQSAAFEKALLEYKNIKRI
jgi:hypothetical protein